MMNTTITTVVVGAGLAVIISTVVVLTHNAVEFELALNSHIYIKIGGWDYWKQWQGSDINE